MTGPVELRNHSTPLLVPGNGSGVEEHAGPKGNAAKTDRLKSTIRLLDLSFEEPEMNLACDEFLLDSAESGRGGEILRFWESPTPFVVLGVSQSVREHVREHHCQSDKVHVLRRCSAGGCVLQGPGCLNFTLVLSHKLHPDVATIRGSYCYILGRIASALRARGVSACHKGVSDLAVGGKKISGNAQRRCKGFILHHGTILYAMDSALMERYLIEPNDRPRYRGNRPHSSFVRCVSLGPDVLREAIREAFEVGAAGIRLRKQDRAAIERMAREKYLSRAWIYRR